MRSPSARLSAQHGLITGRQLADLGWTASARRNAVRRGVWRTPDAPVSWESELLAAVLAAGSGAVASHLCAVRLWRLVPPEDFRWCAALELSSPRSLVLTGVRSHRRAVPPWQVSRRSQVPVTSVAWTLHDMAETAGVAGVGRALDEALRRRIVRLADVRALVEGSMATSGRWRAGTATLGCVVAERCEVTWPSANDWEAEMDRCWDRWGLPTAARQHPIETPGGTYRPDRAIPELRIAVDWNGYEYHGLRSRFDADSDRRADLVAAGWLPLDFTSRSSPERICRSVRAACRDRAGTLPPGMWHQGA